MRTVQTTVLMHVRDNRVERQRMPSEKMTEGGTEKPKWPTLDGLQRGRQTGPLSGPAKGSSGTCTLDKPMQEAGPFFWLHVERRFPNARLVILVGDEDAVASSHPLSYRYIPASSLALCWTINSGIGVVPSKH